MQNTPGSGNALDGLLRFDDRVHCREHDITVYHYADTERASV